MSPYLAICFASWQECRLKWFEILTLVLASTSICSGSGGRADVCLSAWAGMSLIFTHTQCAGWSSVMRMSYLIYEARGPPESHFSLTRLVSFRFNNFARETWPWLKNTHFKLLYTTHYRNRKIRTQLHSTMFFSFLILFKFKWHVA